MGQLSAEIVGQGEAISRCTARSKESKQTILYYICVQERVAHANYH
jgi:hypothetical protein